MPFDPTKLAQTRENILKSKPVFNPAKLEQAKTAPAFNPAKLEAVKQNVSEKPVSISLSPKPSFLDKFTENVTIPFARKMAPNLVTEPAARQTLTGEEQPTVIQEVVERPIAGLRAVSSGQPLASGLIHPEKYPPGTFAKNYVNAGVEPNTAGALGTLADVGYYLGLPEALMRSAPKPKGLIPLPSKGGPGPGISLGEEIKMNPIRRAQEMIKRGYGSANTPAEPAPVEPKPVTLGPGGGIYRGKPIEPVVTEGVNAPLVRMADKPLPIQPKAPAFVPPPAPKFEEAKLVKARASIKNPKGIHGLILQKYGGINPASIKDYDTKEDFIQSGLRGVLNKNGGDFGKIAADLASQGMLEGHQEGGSESESLMSSLKSKQSLNKKDTSQKRIEQYDANKASAIESELESLVEELTKSGVTPDKIREALRTGETKAQNEQSETVEPKELSEGALDFNPEDYAPEVVAKNERPKLEKLKDESLDKAIERSVGYQIENGVVKLEETTDGWKAIVSGGEEPKVFRSYKKQQVLNDVHNFLNPEYGVSEKQSQIPGTQAKFPEGPIRPTDKNLIQEKPKGELFSENLTPEQNKGNLKSGENNELQQSLEESFKRESPSLTRDGNIRRRKFIKSVQDQIRKTGRVDLVGKEVSDTEELAYLLQAFRHPSQEQFHVVYIDKSGKILAHNLTTSRDIDVISLDTTRLGVDVNRIAEKLGAETIALMHNHPSGNPTPSDMDVTSTISLAGKINPQGKYAVVHLVLNGGKYSVIEADGKVTKDLNYKNESYNIVQGETVKHSKELIDAFKMVQKDEKTLYAFLMGADKTVVAVEPISQKVMAKGTLSKLIYDMKKSYGASRYVLIGGKESGIKSIDQNLMPIGFVNSHVVANNFISYDLGGNETGLPRKDAPPGQQLFENKEPEQPFFEGFPKAPKIPAFLRNLPSAEAVEITNLAKSKGLLYEVGGKFHGKLSGLLAYYKGSSVDQFKDYISALTGKPEDPPKLFKLYGDIEKDTEAMKLLAKASGSWQDINAYEKSFLEPPRIIEKVTGKDLWDNNFFADNTFQTIAGADAAMFDRHSKEIQELQNSVKVKAGSNESAEIMRKFEAKAPLTPEEQNVVNFLRAKYEGFIREANEMRQRIGKPPIPYRKDYMTHIREQNLLMDFFKGDSDAMKNITRVQLDAMAAGDFTKGNMPFNRFALKRMGPRTKYDAIGNYGQYLRTILKEIYYAPALSHARAFVEYATVNQPNARMSLNRWLNDLKGKKNVLDEMLGFVASSRAVKKLRSMLAKGALFGNINFMARNASNFSTSYPELGNYMNRGMMKFLGNKEFRDFAHKHSVMLRSRTIDPDIDPSRFKTFEQLLNFMTTMIELNNVGSTWSGAYLKALDLGFDQQKAFKYADAIARKAQVGYKKYEVSAWMNSDTGKLLSQFQTWSFNALHYILYDIGTASIPKNIASKLTGGKIPAGKKVKWGAFWSLFFIAVIFNEFYKKLGIRPPYEITSAAPNIPNVPKFGLDPGKYDQPPVYSYLSNIGRSFLGKKPETRAKAKTRLVTSLIPGGVQAQRFAEGRVLPEYSDKKKEEKKPAFFGSANKNAFFNAKKKPSFL